MDGGRIGGGVFRSLLEPRARSLVHARGAPLMCRLHRVLANSRRPPTAPDSVFLPWQKSSSFFSFFHSSPSLYPQPLLSSLVPLFLFLSLFLLVLLAFSVVISPSGLRSWLVINESRKNRGTEGGSVERRRP